MLHISHDQRVLGRATRTARTGLRLKVLPVAVALCFCPALWAGINDSTAGLPMGGTVAAGSVSGGVTGNQLTLTQTGSRAVIDWQSFNINTGKTVQFVQPSATSAVLNRVPASAGLSEIYGTLTANGMVLLMNPNGVLFGAGANINVGSLIATTGTINQSDFMGGGAFAISGATAGSVTNRGTITAESAGLVALVAPSVSNQGIITATGGTVLLAGVSAATISMNGGLYEFVTGAAGANVANSGTIQADGGTVLLTAANASAILDNVINMDGIIQARTVGTRDGSIVLEGGDSGNVRVTGRLDATGGGGTTGGKITVTGKSVELTAAARLDASGDAGGGAVLVGGNWQGKGPERNAQTTTVAAGATLRADAVSNGDGGKVVVWADGTTRFNGEISSRGGAAGGDGGSVEVSGKQSLGYDGMVDTSAAKGRTGSLLLDPDHAVISDAAAGTTGSTETINAAALVNTLNSTNFTVQADTDVTVDAAVNASGNANAHNLAFNAPTVDLNAAITLKTGATLSGTASAVNVNGSNARIQNGVDVATSGGTVNVAAGTYAENVSVAKALTLNGAGAGNSIIDPVSGDAVTVSGNIGASSSVLIDGFTFHDAQNAGVRVAGDTTLGQLTVQNSDFLNNGKYGFFVEGSSTAGVPGLANVSLLNSTFEGNGAHFDLATSLGQGAVNFNYYNGNATLRGLTITGDNEFVGIQMRGYHNASTQAVYDTGTWVFDNVTIGGSFRRPSDSFNGNNWNTSGPGDAIHLLEYGSVANVSFNNVVINPTVGHGMFLEGLSSTLNIGNTRFSVPDSVITGDGLTPTRSYNIVSGANLQNNVRTNINATQAVFTGASNGFDIEDRVAHTLDRAELGLVTWNAGNVYVTPASGSIQRGVDAASAGNTVNVAAGNYTERVKVNKTNLTLAGQAGAKIMVPDDPSFDGITIEANNATVSGFEIVGPLTSPYYTYYTSATYPNGFPWSSISRGIVASRGATGFVITNNNIHDVRTGILIDGRDSGQGAITGSVTGNIIENTKSGISVQYTDGTDGAGLTRITMAGNSEGPIGNEWGINLHLNGFLDGGTTYTDNPHRTAPTLAWQQALLDLSASNGGWAVQDQGYSSSNRTQAMVATSTGPATTQGSRLTPFTSVQSGVDAVVTGGKVTVAAGSYAENLVLNNRYNLRFSGVTLQGLTLNAGAAGSGIGGQVTVNGAGGIAINAAINLLADTTLATTGSNITLGGDVQNAGSTPYALTLTAGAGSSRGNVSMTSGGSASNPLGQLEIKSSRFTLADTLWVTGYKIDALGDVALSNHTLNATQAGVTNTLATTGNVTGSTTSQGSVEVVSSGDVSANVAAQGRASVAAENISGNISGSDVAATAQGAMDITVTASNSATLVADTVAATVTAPTVSVDSGGRVDLALHSGNATVHADGPVNVSGSASSVSIDAPSGSVNGSFGDVNNAGNGLFNINGRPELNQTLTANAENNRVIPDGSAFVENTTPDVFQSGGLTRAVALFGSRGERISRTTVAGAGNAMDRGQPVEIDLTPGKEKEKK